MFNLSSLNNLGAVYGFEALYYLMMAGGINYF
jgi:hypothetical protein